MSSILENPAQPIDPQWVEAMSREYPYFTLPAALLLKRGGETLTAAQREELTSRLVLNVADKESLYALIDEDAARMAHFYPEEKNAEPITTNDAIDTFINTYGTPDPKEEEMLTRLIFNPTPDYAQLLAEEEGKSVPTTDESAGDSQDALINAFIIKSREQHGHFPSSVEPEEAKQPEQPQQEAVESTPVKTPDATDASMLSESLAKIYIKQRRYEKAYEIITNLSLNYPEKSIYFADQLRFLRKLIINQQYSSKNN